MRTCHLSIYLSIHPSIHPSIHLSLSAHPSTSIPNPSPSRQQPPHRAIEAYSRSRQQRRQEQANPSPESMLDTTRSSLYLISSASLSLVSSLSSLFSLLSLSLSPALPSSLPPSIHPSIHPSIIHPSPSSLHPPSLLSLSIYLIRLIIHLCHNLIIVFNVFVWWGTNMVCF